MKDTTIYLGNNKIEVYNSILGKETIKVNDVTVSSKFSMFGTEHIFKITENNKDIECRLSTGFSRSGIVSDLYKGNEPIIQTEKTGCIRFFIIILVAVLIYGLINWLFN
jgi:hypothetical protein